MSRFALVSLALALPSLAAAVPLELTHSGRLFDSSGTPLDGSHDLAVSLYDAPAGSTPSWTDTFSAELDEGFFTVRLGSGTVLPAELFDGSLLYVAMAVDGEAELSGRLPLTSVPYAVRTLHAATSDEATHAATADSATEVTGGVVNASSVQINGVTVIDGTGAISAPVAWSDLTGVPSELTDGDADALGAVGSCSDGQVLTWASGAWACGDGVPSSVAWSSLTGVPSGLADGDADTLGDLTCDEGDFAQNTSSGWACASALTVLQAAGSSASCEDASEEGLLRYEDGALAVCTDDGWQVLAGAEPKGSSQNDAALSCAAIHEAYPSLSTGTYWLDLDGAGSDDPFEAHCEMTQNGGGWTRCAAFRNESPSNITGFTFTYTAWDRGVLGYSDTGNFCMDLGAGEVFGEAWNNASSMQLRTAAIEVSDTMWDLGTFTAYSANGSCVGVKHTSGFSQSQTGGTTCGVLNNGQNQGSGVSVAAGSEWRGVHGNLNNSTTPRMRMCDASSWCGSGNNSAAIYLYMR